jgi:hypothetical protein
MKNCDIAFGNTLKSKLLGACNPSSNNVMIEPSMPKSFKIICLPKASFKFHYWDRIHDNIVKGPMAMFWTKIIDIPKETVKCDWDNEYNLKDELKYHPPKTTSVT